MGDIISELRIIESRIIEIYNWELNNPEGCKRPVINELCQKDRDRFYLKVRIRAAFIRSGKTREQFETDIHRSRRTVTAYMNINDIGDSIPEDRNMGVVARALGVPVEYLLGVDIPYDKSDNQIARGEITQERNNKNDPVYEILSEAGQTAKKKVAKGTTYLLCVSTEKEFVYKIERNGINEHYEYPYPNGFLDNMLNRNG